MSDIAFASASAISGKRSGHSRSHSSTTVQPPMKRTPNPPKPNHRPPSLHLPNRPKSRTSSIEGANSGQESTPNSDSIKSSSKRKPRPKSQLIPDDVVVAETRSAPVSNTSPSKRNGRKKAKQRPVTPPEGQVVAVAIPGAGDSPNEEDDSNLHFSRSAPNLRQLRNGTSDWDMPDTPLKPREELTWQQQTSSLTNLNHVNAELRKPKDSPRKKDSVYNTVRSDPPPLVNNLTWQQELLKSSTGSLPKGTIPSWAGTETPERRSLPTKSSRSAGKLSNKTSLPTPQSLSASVANLSLTEPFIMDDVFLSSAKPRSDPTSPRYAGPNFHNSPSPHSLPAPTLVRRSETVV